MRARILIGLFSGLLLSTACGKGGLTDLNNGEMMNPADMPMPNPELAEVTKIEVNPSSITLVEDASVAITATGFKSDGTSIDITKDVTWASANEAVAAISAEGLLSAVGPGDTTIDAKLGMLTATVQVSISDAKLTGLIITPDGAATAVGGVVPFQCFGLLDDGNKIDLSRAVTWSVADAQVASIDATGLVTALAGGKTVILAEFSGFDVFVELEVSEAKITSILVEPDVATLAPGSVQAFSATAILDDGTRADLTATVTWFSTDDSIVSVAGGIANAYTPGEATITAKLDGISGQAKVNVTAYELIQIRIEPSQLTLQLGEESILRAIGVYENMDEVDLTRTVQWRSNNDRVVSVSNAQNQEGQVTAIAAGQTEIIASLGQLSGQIEVEVSEAELISIEFGRNSISIAQGGTAQLAAYGVYSDGSRRDVTNQATWASADSQIATVNNMGSGKGRVSAISQGETTVAFGLEGISANISVVVTPPGLVEIIVTPDNQTIEEEQRINYQAEAVYSDGTRADIRTDATWSVTNTSLADISNAANAEGRLISRDDGTLQVRAAFEGITGETTLTITPPTLVSIQISPINPTMAISDFSFLSATAVYSNGTTREISGDATWASSDSSVVNVMSSRRGAFAEAVGAGTSVISASFQNQTSMTTFTVNNATVVSLSISPIVWTAPAGDSRRFAVEAFYSDGSSSEVTWMASWSSSDGSVASVSNSQRSRGEVDANAAGTAQITATYEGIQVSSSVTVTAAVINSIQVTPFMASMSPGQVSQFQAVAIMSDGSTENISRDASWVSTDQAVAGVGNSRWDTGRVTAVAAGTTTIRASLDGITGETTLSVSSASIDRVQVTPFIPTVPVGYGLQMRATVIYTDGTTRDVTNAVTWASSDVAVGAVSNARNSEGWLTTVSAGQINVTAQYMGVTGSTTVSVNGATLMSIMVTPNVGTVMAGQSLQFTATGNFDDGSTFDVTWYVTWNASDLTVADVSNAWGSQGRATGFSTGMSDIIASQVTTSGTLVSGTASLIVL
jgi:hypothetical protein